MSRLFVFGCSFSAYCWPTWADLVSTSFDEYYNYGLSGLGNRAITERIAEANHFYNFNKDDTIIVQWSTHVRHDWFNPEGLTANTRLSGWKTYGSIFNYHNRELFDNKWVDTFFHEPTYFYHTLNFISLTQSLLENTGAKWYMTGIGDIRHKGTDLALTPPNYAETPGELNQKYDDYIGWIESPTLKKYEEKIWGENKNHWIDPIFPNTIKEHSDFITLVHPDDGEYHDGHPTTVQHSSWIEEFFITQTDIDIDMSKVKQISDKFIELYTNSQRVFMHLERLLRDEKWDGNLPFWPNEPLGLYTV